MSSLQARMQASLKSLENYLDKIEVLNAVSGKNSPVDTQSVKQLSEGIDNLKDALHRAIEADKLPNKSEAQQATKVFYGIHALLRPEIIATFVVLAKGYSLKFSNQAAQPEVVH